MAIDDRFKGSLYQGVEKPSLLSRVGTALQGFGAGYQGQGQEFLANLERKRQREQDELMQASISDAQEIKRLLRDKRDTPYREGMYDNPIGSTVQAYNQEGIKESVDILNDRISLLRQRGQDDSDTFRIRDRILQGDISGADAEIDNFLRQAKGAGYQTERFIENAIELADGRLARIRDDGSVELFDTPKTPTDPIDNFVALTPELATQLKYDYPPEIFAKGPMINLTTGEVTFPDTHAGASNTIYTGEFAGVKLPPDMQWDFDENGEIIGMRPIAGSDTAEERNQLTQAGRTKDANQAFYTSASYDSLGMMKSLLENETASNPVTGIGTKVFAEVPGSAFNNFVALKNTLNASIAFDRLQAMREASKTGGALGAISERELDLLAASIGSLDNSKMSNPVLMAQIERIEKQYIIAMRSLAKLAINDKQEYGDSALYDNMMELGYGAYFDEAMNDAATATNTVDSNRLNNNDPAGLR